MYDDFDIELARKSGAPDPEGNAQRANEILALLNREIPDIQAAKAQLPGITDPLIRQGLEELIEFDATCRCFRVH